MNQQDPRIYRFAGIEIDTPKLRLKRDGEEKHLRQKTFQVLVYLVEHPERLITKNELIEKIWLGAAVTDNTLEQCLAEIRRVLGDDSRNPRFVKTVPRAGYRFIADVNRADGAADPTETVAIAPKASERRPPARRSPAYMRGVLISGAVFVVLVFAVGGWYAMRQRASRRLLVPTPLTQDPKKRAVAVMFFDNESASADLDWLREGLADMIITDLSRSSNLAVLSRQQLHVLLDRMGLGSSQKITLDEALSVAQQTQAKIMVLGTFARLGEQIRIDVHLHDARDGELLTAERIVLDHPAQLLSEVDLLSLKLQSYMGGSPPAESRATMPAVLTDNLEAFRFYSLGVEKAQALQNAEAVGFLQKAVALDPNFAMAYARIGYTLGVMEDSPEKAKPYLEKAFKLTERLSEKDKLNIEAWYAIANYDYAGAIDAFRRVIAQYPMEVEAYSRLASLLAGEERFPEAIEVIKQAMVIDSGDKNLYNSLGSIYVELGRHDEATATLQRFVQLAPEEPNSHDSLGLAYQWAGQYDDASREFERALQIKPDWEIAIVHLANVYFQQGRYRAAIDEFHKYINAAPSDGVRRRGWLAIGYVQAHHGDFSAAERDARQGSRILAGPSQEVFLIMIAKGDLKTARQISDQFEQMQTKTRGSRESRRPLWVRRGLLALRANSPDEAIDDLKEALKHRPLSWNIDSYEDCLANAYLELGRLDEAIAEYQRILKLNPNYPLVHYHLAQAYERKGQREIARSEYEQFLQIWKGADADVPEVVAAKKAFAT